GVPLRVGGDEPNEEERKALKELEPKIRELEMDIKQRNEEIKARTNNKNDPKAAEIAKDLRKQLEPLQQKLRGMNQRRNFLNHSESHACVDSELMLLWWDDYELRRWQVNL